MRRCLVLRIGLCAVLLCASASAQTKTAILGHVMGKKGEMVQRVHIDATNTSTHQMFSTVSEADGGFRLTVPVGHYVIHYYRKGFKTGTVETDALIGRSTDLNISGFGPEQNGQIRVHVKDAKGHGAPSIKISIKSDYEEYEGVTDDQGDYVQGGLGGGTYKVIAIAGASPCKNVKIDDGQSRSITLNLSIPCQ